MKPKRLIIAGIVLVVLIAGYLLLVNGVGRVVVISVNRLGPQLAQTGVTLGGAQVSPLSGHCTLENLVVDNPPGWSSRSAFSLKKVSVSAEPSSLFGDRIVIDEIQVDGADFSYETRLVTSNVGQILKSIQGKKPDSGQDATTKEGKTIKYIIKKLSVKNAKVTVGVGPAAVVLQIPDEQFQNLGSQDGVTSTQLAYLVTQTLLGTVVKTTVHAAGKVTGSLGAAATDALKDAGGAVGNLIHH